MKIIKNLQLQAISMLIFSNVIAADSGFDEIATKLDTIEANQERFISKTIDSPLGKRKNGIELNLARILVLQDEYKSFSGTYSRFDHKNGAEWAFPVFFSSEDNYENEQTNVATVDAHYRKFLGGSVKGFYLSGFSRLTHISGPTGYDFDFSFNDEQSSRSNETKVGVGVGIGYRIFSGEKFYWGTSLSFGRNIIGENDKFQGAIFDDSEYILDIEFLKFGYSF